MGRRDSPHVSKILFMVLPPLSRRQHFLPAAFALPHNTSALSVPLILSSQLTTLALSSPYIPSFPPHLSSIRGMSLCDVQSTVQAVPLRSILLSFSRVSGQPSRLVRWPTNLVVDEHDYLGSRPYAEVESIFDAGEPWVSFGNTLFKSTQNPQNGCTGPFDTHLLPSLEIQSTHLHYLHFFKARNPIFRRHCLNLKNFLSFFFFQWFMRSFIMRLMYIKVDNLHVQRVSIYQYQFPPVAKLRHRDYAHGLPCWALYHSRAEPRLVPHEINVWTFLNHELILFLKRVAPCVCSQQEVRAERLLFSSFYTPLK